MATKPFLIVKVGSTFAEMVPEHGDFDDWVLRAMDLDAREAVVVAVHQGARLPDPMDTAGVVVTGSHAMVSDHEPWSEAVAEWIRRLVPRGVPFLGVCYGHQLLAHALGGTVGYHPGGPEVGTVPVRLTAAAHADPLLGGLPREFHAHSDHHQSILRLPMGAVVLAANDFERCHAIRIGAAAWGVQFHPEFDETAMRFYIDAQRDALRSKGQDPDQLLKAIRPTPESASVLRRFVALARRPRHG